MGIVVDNTASLELWIVTEFLDGGTLRPYCTGDLRLTATQRLRIGEQCWSALEYLNEKVSIAHKDIKPENILVSTSYSGFLIRLWLVRKMRTNFQLQNISESYKVAKICDFGLAKITKNFTTTVDITSMKGTFMYCPPEIYDKKINWNQYDVYSLGATMCEFFTNTHFWQSDTPTPLGNLEVSCV